MSAKTDDSVRVWPAGAIGMTVLGGFLLAFSAIILASGLSDSHLAYTGQRGLEAMGPIDWLIPAVLAGLGLLCFRTAHNWGLGRRVSPSEIRAGLGSPDEVLRLKSVKRLDWLSDPEVPSLAYAMLTDPAPKVRLAVLGVVLGTQAGRTMLAKLLAQDKQDLDRREYILRLMIWPGMGPVVSGAVREAESREIRRDLLHRMEKWEFAKLPWLESDRRLLYPWPDRCCVCGRPAPASHKELVDWHSFKGETGHGPNDMGETVSVKILFCQQCKSSHKPSPGFKVERLKVRVRVKSAEFADELLESGGWTAV